MFFWRLDSKPTINSTLYRHSFDVLRSKSARCASPVLIDGLLYPGRSTYRQEPFTLCRHVARKLRMESCLQVNRSRYDWQPATTCRRVSGARHLEQPGEGVIPHLVRFWRIGRALLMYRTVKLNIFCARFNCETDHIFVSFDREKRY